MVKVADLGYPSTNIEKVPTKKQKKEEELQRAIRNLAGAEVPSRLSLTDLPDYLQAAFKGQ